MYEITSLFAMKVTCRLHLFVETSLSVCFFHQLSALSRIWVGWVGFDSRLGQRFFSLPPHADWLWCYWLPVVLSFL